MRLALSMSEINENVFNIERYLRKSYPAFKLFFIVSNHFFLHTEQLLKAYITELDQTEIQDITFVQAIPLFTSLQGTFKAFISCIIETLAAQSFSKLWHIQTPINHLQDIGISILQSIICQTRAFQDFDQSFARLGHIRTLIYHLQDSGISRLRSIICKTLA